MSKQLQIRLTGALVLLALAFVLILLLFDGDGLEPATPISVVRLDSKDDLKTAAPPADVSSDRWKFWQAAEGLRSGVDSSSLTPDYLRIESGKLAISELPESQSALAGTAFDDQGLPVAWAVQVGSFSNLKNASKLKAKLDAQAYLKAEGHGAYLSHVQSPKTNKPVYRVAVGPFLNRHAAVEVQSRLKREAITPEAIIRIFSLTDQR